MGFFAIVLMRCYMDDEQNNLEGFDHLENANR